jgi:hypothetical protein
VIDLTGLTVVIPDNTTLSRRGQKLPAISRGPAPVGSPHMLVDSTGVKMCGAGKRLETQGELTMPAPKTYTKAHWDELVRLLDALPETPPSEHDISVRDAMSNVRAHIDAARAKGYSVEEAVDEAKRARINVTGRCASICAA